MNQKQIVERIHEILDEELGSERRKAHWLNNPYSALKDLGAKKPQELIDEGRAEIVLGVLENRNIFA